MRFDLLIINGMVLTMNREMEVIDQGYVLVNKGKIIDLGSMDEYPVKSQEWTLCSDKFEVEKVMDANGGIIMPGLINVHTHASMTLFRGLADDLPLMTWLQEHIFPAEAGLTEEKVYKGAMLACGEMILSGTTCFCDMYLFENQVAEAAKNAGMRAVVGEVLYDFASPNYGRLDKGFEYVEKMIDQYKDDPLIIPAVEPHSTYLCAPELLKRAAELAREHKIPLVIHVAETLGEKAQIKERYDKTPVQFLNDTGVLSPGLVACHSVHLSEDDMELYREHGVKVAHCPESNMKLASGVAPVPGLLERGICVGLGTDGCASNNDLDMFLEMDKAAKIHKVFSMDPEVVDAETTVKMATIDGAGTLGISHVTGSLEPGKLADIIVIDTDKPHLVPMYNPYSHLVYSVNGNDVAATIINGRVVMENGHIFTMDIARVMDDVKSLAENIKANDLKR